MTKKIKSIKRFNQNYKNFSFSDLTNRAEEEFIEFIIRMDDNGNAIEESKFSSDGTLEEKNSFEYDSNNKLIGHTLFYALDDMTEKRLLTRNEKGQLLSETKYYGSESGEKTQYEYNDKGNISAILIFDEDGTFVTREEILYDASGSLSERCTKDANNNILKRITLSPMVENKIEELEYDDKGILVSKSVITLNDKGKELSTVQTNPQGKLISSVSNTYDDRGNITKKVYKDFYSKSLLYEYNEKDQLVVQELFDDNGLLLKKNLYEYDEEGNIITEQTYEMDTTRGGRDKHFGTRYDYEYL